MYGSIVRLDRAAAISQFFLHWANVASFGILSNSYLSVGAENWRDSQLWFALGSGIYECTRENSLYFYSILYCTSNCFVKQMQTYSFSHKNKKRNSQKLCRIDSPEPGLYIEGGGESV